jgi:hypothetical protein
LPSWLLVAMLGDRQVQAGLPELRRRPLDQDAGDHAAASAEKRPQHPMGARERVRSAKRRELAAHDRAIDRHEQAAELQERLGHTDRAARAREHARHARELRDLAARELQEWEQRDASR